MVNMKHSHAADRRRLTVARLKGGGPGFHSSAGSCIWPAMTAKVDAPKIDIVKTLAMNIWNSFTEPPPWLMAVSVVHCVLQIVAKRLGVTSAVEPSLIIAESARGGFDSEDIAYDVNEGKMRIGVGSKEGAQGGSTTISSDDKYWMNDVRLCRAFCGLSL